VASVYARCGYVCVCKEAVVTDIHLEENHDEGESGRLEFEPVTFTMQIRRVITLSVPS
jgi:hypothetical protein